MRRVAASSNEDRHPGGAEARNTGDRRQLSPAQNRTIVVVAAVIEDGGSFLLTRRPAGTHLEGLWEFPGGKVEPGETHQQALTREIHEELATSIEVLEPVAQIGHAYPDRVVELHFYRCRLLGVPHAALDQEMQWVRREALRSLGFPPADEALITLLSESASR